MIAHCNCGAALKSHALERVYVYALVRLGRGAPRNAVEEAGLSGAVRNPQAGGSAPGSALSERLGKR